MTFHCTNEIKLTMKPPKLGRIQCSDGIGHAGWFADSMGVDSPDSEVVGVSFKQSRHWVFTDLYGVIVALGPVVSSNLTSRKTLKGKEDLRRQTHAGKLCIWKYITCIGHKVIKYCNTEKNKMVCV